jgi:hypothetical protein
MTYDYSEMKTVAVLYDKLEIGTAMNVLGHMAQSIGAFAGDSLMGRPKLVDKAGVIHRGIAKYGFIITKTNASKLRAAVALGRTKSHVIMVDFPRQMLETRHDDELETWVAEAHEESLKYLGAIFFGPSNDVQEITGKFSLFK